MAESATEVMEFLGEVQEVADNPGLLRTWLEGLVPDLMNFALQIVIAIVIYIIGGKIIGAIVRMTRRSMEKAGADEGVKQFVLQVVKYGLYVILVFIIMGLFGIATTSAVAVLGSAGVAIGLALQGSLSNFAGGVLLLLLKPFRVGDYVVINDSGNEGTVTEISIFYTKLLTGDNKMVAIPNGTLSNSSLTNVSQMNSRRVDITVGISYEADIRTAKAVLMELVEKEPAKLPEKDPVVFVSNLGDSAVELGVRFWVAAGNYWEAKWRMTENIKYALDEHGICIPYPQMDVTIHAPEHSGR